MLGTLGMHLGLSFLHQRNGPKGILLGADVPAWGALGGNADEVKLLFL